HRPDRSQIQTFPLTFRRRAPSRSRRPDPIRRRARTQPTPRRRRYRAFVTPIRAQYGRMAHAPQRGESGRQTFWPQVTRYKLMYGHQRGFVARYNACYVSSGVLVLTQPRRLEIRCTCVSTQMFLTLLKERINTRFAVLRPTPGSI